MVVLTKLVKGRQSPNKYPVNGRKIPVNTQLSDAKKDKRLQDLSNPDFVPSASI
jgi:hypothetical protein